MLVLLWHYYQVFFLELRKLERLAESNVVEKEWLMEILKELIEAVFVWISNEKKLWDTNAENLTAEDSLNFKQVHDSFPPQTCSNSCYATCTNNFYCSF